MNKDIEIFAFSDINVSLDISTKTLKLTLPKDFKFEINGELNIETTGEINLLSKGSDINIDSLNSNMWINSFKCKQLMSDPLSYKHAIDADPVVSPIFELKQQLTDMNNKILELEGKLK